MLGGVGDHCDSNLSTDCLGILARPKAVRREWPVVAECGLHCGKLRKGICNLGESPGFVRPVVHRFRKDVPFPE